MRIPAASIGRWLVEQDMFGHPITVFYKGSDQFKTKVGALFTLLIYVITLIYLMVRLSALVSMSDPDVLIMTKSLLQSQKADFIPLNLHDAYFNMGVLVLDGKGVPIEVPSELGKFVLQTTNGNKNLEPCLDVLPPTVLQNSKMEYIRYFETGLAWCIPTESSVVETFDGDGNTPLNMAFENCAGSGCQAALDAWLKQHSPEAHIFGTKRLVDYQAQEDYIFDQMELLFKRPMSNEGQSDYKVSLEIASLVLKDKLYNPFDQTTEEILYLKAEGTQLNTPGSYADGINFKIAIVFSNDMIVSERKRYNIWDALGDIGGFHDGLVLLVQVFMGSYSNAMFEQSVLHGSRFSRKGKPTNERARQNLVKMLSSGDGDVTIDKQSMAVFASVLDSIEKLKGSTINCFKDFFVCCGGRRKAAKAKVLEQFADHLDVQTLIESQVNLHQALKFLFTKKQRLMLAFQRSRFPNVASDDSSGSSDMDRFQKTSHEEADFMKSLQGTVVSTKLSKKMLLSVLCSQHERDAVFDSDPEEAKKEPVYRANNSRLDFHNYPVTSNNSATVDPSAYSERELNASLVYELQNIAHRQAKKSNKVPINDLEYYE